MESAGFEPVMLRGHKPLITLRDAARHETIT